MTNRLTGVLALLVVPTVGLVASPAADDPEAVRKRVAELIAVLDHPDARSTNLNETVKAIDELKRIGGPAAPQLVEAALRVPPVDYAGRVLELIGHPALPAIRAKWPDLNDERRWKLMPVLEKHDRESVREYALNCLDSEGPARLQAWGFVLRTKDRRAEERYFELLEFGGPRQDPGADRWVRAYLLPGDKPVFDERRENDALIRLLSADSWLAKGLGNLPQSGDVPPSWPDGRPRVIEALHRRKVKAAGPALVKLLDERNPGAGYLASRIIPVLIDLGHTDALPALDRIAATQPVPGKLNQRDPHAAGEVAAVRKMAAEAALKLRGTKP